MALTDAIPSPGLLDMIQLGTSLVLAGPLLVATVLFATRGDLPLAAFTAGLALVALYLPTYVVDNLVPDSIVPARIRRLLDRLPFR